MIWNIENGKKAPGIAISQALAAASKHDVPVGILLGTVQCESTFRLGVVSSAGAVGPCQFLPKYASDYYRYAGFEFDLEGWESIEGMAAVYVYYAKIGAQRYGFKGEDGWRYALLSHRYGQNSEKAKTLYRADRIVEVEAAMRRNGVWYQKEEPVVGVDGSVAKKAVQWALGKVGKAYSQAKRAQPDYFDCSSLVARAYGAQGVDWKHVGQEIPLSSQEVYSDQFELLWPANYQDIGVKMGGIAQINLARKVGDLQFLRASSSTKRKNKITHVTMVVDESTIVHARSTNYGVRTDKLSLYSGKVCAVVRYNPACTLRKGMRGLRVKALQERLNQQGAALAVDGVYGSSTEAAVRKYAQV